MVVKHKFLVKEEIQVLPYSFEKQYGALRVVRSKEEELKTPYNLEKQNTSVFLYFTTSLNLVRREEMILQLQKRFIFKTVIDLCWVIKKLLSTKDKSEIGIFRFLDGFLKYKIQEKDKELRGWEKELIPD